MTSEDVERAIEFLLQNQAKHDAQLGELRGQVAGLTQQIAETNRIVQMHAETQGEFIQIVTKALSDLAEAQRRNDAQIAESASRADGRTAVVEERIAEVEERNARRHDEAEQRHARRYDELDARLERLTVIVERIAELRAKE